jgi:hypothetical protein
MSTTVNGVNGNFEGNNTANDTFNQSTKKVGPSIWDTMKSGVSRTYDKSVSATGEFMTQKVAPKVTDAIVGTDWLLMSASKKGINFFVKYPGFAIALNPGTALKMIVATHIETMVEGAKSNASRVVVTNTGDNNS